MQNTTTRTILPPASREEMLGRAGLSDRHPILTRKRKVRRAKSRLR